MVEPTTYLSDALNNTINFILPTNPPNRYYVVIKRIDRSNNIITIISPEVNKTYILDSVNNMDDRCNNKFF